VAGQLTGHPLSRSARHHLHNCEGIPKEEPMKIRTNNNRRELLDSSQLTEKERAEFTYLDWAKLDEGTDSATFFRFKGQVYDMGDFTRLTSTPGWDAGMATSAFTGILIRLDPEDNDLIIVGQSFS
jgi:hypothetical protein